MSPTLLYVTARDVHLTAVSLSLLFFLVRAAGVWRGAAWPMSTWARRSSMLIDSVLLLAGLTLWAVLRLDPLGRDLWLGVKLALLVAYIVLGSLALRRARTRRARAWAMAGAVACAAAMVGIAIAHHPAGWWFLYGRG